MFKTDSDPDLSSYEAFLFSLFLNVDGAAFWLLLPRCQVTLLTVDNEAQRRFVLSKPYALCGIRFLSVRLSVSVTLHSRSGE